MDILQYVIDNYGDTSSIDVAGAGSLVVEILLGYLLADFIMGFYHWVKDTYFSPFTPIIGRKFIWGSRLHHVRPRCVLDTSDVDLFTTSAIWTAIWMVPLALFTGLSAFIISLFITISMNDIVHKYAHMYEEERPPLATLLQRAGIFQSHDEHHLHHVSPHEINYCPISPYVNTILEKVLFWRLLESFIERVFGVKPRAVEYDFIDLDDETTAVVVDKTSFPCGIKFLPQDTDKTE